MTRLADRKTRLQFQTDALIGRRTLVIHPTPLTCILREKGRRRSYEVSWQSVFWLAAKVAADNERRKRKLNKKPRGKIHVLAASRSPE